MHTILPVYLECESVGVTQKSACEPVGVSQKTHDHNYFHTRSVVITKFPQGCGLLKLAPNALRSGIYFALFAIVTFFPLEMNFTKILSPTKDAEEPQKPPALCRRQHKIKFEDSPTDWKNYGSGRMNAFHALDNLYAHDGVLCLSVSEKWPCEKKVIEEPWVGFVHQTPASNFRCYAELVGLVQDQCFIKSLEKCHGLFVFSRVVKAYLQSHFKVPIVQMLYPVTPFPVNKTFSWEKYKSDKKKNVLFIGEPPQNYHSFHDLVVPPGYQKYLLKSPDVFVDQSYNLNEKRIQLQMDDDAIVTKCS